MCTTDHYRSRACGHHWLAIARPCYPGSGFRFCRTFGDGHAREPSNSSDGHPFRVDGLCPACDERELRRGPGRFVGGGGYGYGYGGFVGGYGGGGYGYGYGGYDRNLVRMVVDIRDRRRWGTGPNTSHVAYERIYEPAEDSFLLLDTLSSASETAFLQKRFLHYPSSSSFSSTTNTTTTSSTPPPPLVVEIGPGSGVVIAFATAHAQPIFGTRHVLTAAIDINLHACRATETTVIKACAAHPSTHGLGFLGALQGDLTTPLRNGAVDVLVFNPPYVPTAELPEMRGVEVEGGIGMGMEGGGVEGMKTTFEEDSRLLALSYAGGRDGMETTERLIASLPRVLSARGCAYVLLCAQNKPEEVKERIRGFGEGWCVETVRDSGKQAGWEKLQIIRIWRE
ncbi:Uu.00g048580.m01.CDS01 [Anthostomella pinea]|uniref:Uu.00g048580.m01.CDS01 n=1 Tax=Anthostomella pinea TaxID=933095 RepID=A0AAI8YEP6_9PEZI|nr:Uu.00g048580.m01.CDS01 [Anthostomella pinea]